MQAHLLCGRLHFSSVASAAVLAEQCLREDVVFCLPGGSSYDQCAMSEQRIYLLPLLELTLSSDVTPQANVSSL